MHLLDLLLHLRQLVLVCRLHGLYDLLEADEPLQRLLMPLREHRCLPVLEHLDVLHVGDEVHVRLVRQLLLQLEDLAFALFQVPLQILDVLVALELRVQQIFVHLHVEDGCLDFVEKLWELVLADFIADRLQLLL